MLRLVFQLNHQKNFLKYWLTESEIKHIIAKLSAMTDPLIQCSGGGIGIRARLRGVWETVRVQVPFTAPKHSNPNLLPIGETFGFVFFVKDVK